MVFPSHSQEERGMEAEPKI